MDGICTALPIQVTKLDRINLQFMQPLLTDEEIGINTKVFGSQLVDVLNEFLLLNTQCAGSDFDPQQVSEMNSAQNFCPKDN